MKDPELRRKFIELRAGGISYVKISKKLNVSKNTLISWSKQLQLDIANHRAIEKEGLCEEFRLGYEQRIRITGNLLTRITEELLSRDLSDVPTPKLLEMHQKISREIAENSDGMILATQTKIDDPDRFKNLLKRTEKWTG